MNYKNRIKKLQNLIAEENCDAFIIDNALNIFYLTGLNLSLGFLMISHDDAKIIVDSRYFESCKKNSEIDVLLLEGNPLEQVLKNNLFSAINIIGFDSQSTSYEKFQIYKKILSQKKIKFNPLPNLVLQLRSIKDKEELNALEYAAEMGSKGFDFVCSLLKEDITEIEIAIELEIFWKRAGSKGLAFEPILAFGKNSSMPHYRPQNIKLKKGDPVLIDIGVNYNFYHSDMTRVPFFGEPSAKMVEIYSIVKEAQEAALDLCKPGIIIHEIDAKAREVMKKYDFDKYFTHSLGHGVGLEIHELPVIKSKNNLVLEPGMVITIEPGIYLPDIGGVRLEDTIVIEEDSYKNLTKRSKDLLIID